jgi:pyruvate/2-oxoglutarate dehydrogenase complex dihydrolipoamide dehydrogenase (E3) component
LAKAARLLRDAEQHEAYGISSVRPRVDFRRLLDQTHATVYRLHEKKQLVGHLERAGVTVMEGVGDAAFVGPNEIRLADGTVLGGDRFIICVGGHARRLTFPGSQLALTHSDVWSIRSLPRSVAIVGSAATGSQLASIFRAFGSRVTLLEVAPRILPGEDELVSWAMRDAFAARDIEIVTGIRGVDRIERDGRSLRLMYSAPEEHATNVDAVLLAVGWTGNLDSLGLDAAGVATELGYVVVDDTLRTSAASIWAAGDVTGRMMLVQSAAIEARVAAANALGVGVRSSGHRVVPHGGFTDPEYAAVGVSDDADREGVVAAVVPYADLDRAVIDGRTEGFAKLVVGRSSRRIEGAHVVGEQAVEVAQVAAAAMAAEMRVEQLAELELAYPTFTAILGIAARQVLAQLEDGERGEGWHTLRRPLAEWERRDLGAVLGSAALPDPRS